MATQSWARTASSRTPLQVTLGWLAAVVRGRETTVALWGILAAVFCVRLFFILNHAGYWGVDGGAYLQSRNTVLGHTAVGMDFARPPLAPGWLLVPFTHLLGDDMGLKAWALLVSFAPVPALLLLARQFLTRRQSIALMGLVMIDLMLAEMFTAGVLPMIGFAWMLAGLWAVWRLAQSTEWRAAGTLIIGIPAIAYTNQTSVAIAAIVLAAFTLGTLLQCTDRLSVLRRVMPASLLGILLGATALPWYSDVTFGSAYVRYPGPLIGPYSFDNAVWFQLALALPIGILAVTKGPPLVRALAWPLLALAALSPWISYDEALMNVFYRSRYLLMVFVWLLGVWAVAKYVLPSSWRTVWKPYLATMAIVAVAAWVHQMHVETKLGRMIAPETLSAIEWIGAQPGDGSVVVNSYSMGLYVGAMTGRFAPWPEVYDPRPAYRAQHWDVLCLFGWTKDCDVSAAVGRLDAEYLLVYTPWPSYDETIAERIDGLGLAYAITNTLSPFGGGDVGRIWQAPGAGIGLNRDLWEITQQAPWLERVWAQGSSVVWRVNKEDSGKSMKRSLRNKRVLGKRPIKGNDKRFLVSIASRAGGGRQMVYARNPAEAENKALINQFARGHIPLGTSVIVTPSKGKQTIVGYVGRRA